MIVTPQERQRIEMQAKAAGKSRSAYVRDLIYADDPAQTHMTDAIAAIGCRLLDLRGELGRIGNNLNQAARVLNMGGHPQDLDHVLQTLDTAMAYRAEVNEIWQSLRPYLQKRR